MELQVNVADLINRLRVDMQELIKESARENVAQIERLRQEINGLQAREQADEAFNNVIAQINGKNMARRMEEETEEDNDV